MSNISKSPERAPTREKRSKLSNDKPTMDKQAVILADLSSPKTDALIKVDSKNILNVGVKKRVRRGTGLTTRCRPGQLIELINSLSTEQRDAVCDIGFGGLLKLQVSCIPQSIIPLLINAFSTGSYMFTASETKQFLLSKDDIHDMFLIPIGGEPVKVVATGRMKGSKDVHLKQYWRDQFGIKNTNNCIPLNKVFDRIKGNKVANDEFKKLFVWYSMSIFLAPTSNYGLDLSLVEAVEDVSQISQQDWCSYVFEALVSALKPPSNRETRSFLCGCTLFLILTYFHRFNFRGVVLDHSLPLIQHWDNKKLEERVTLQLECKGLGDAAMSSIKFPIYPTLANKTVHVSPRPHEKEKVQEVETVQTSRADVAGRAGKRTMLVDLPNGTFTDEEIASTSTDDVQKYMMFIQRDISVFDMRYQMWISAIKESVKSAAEGIIGLEKGVPNDDSQSLGLSPTQAIFSDPNFHKFLDNVEKYSEAIKDILHSLPSFDHLSQINRTIEEAVKTRGLNSERNIIFDTDVDNPRESCTISSFDNQRDTMFSGDKNDGGSCFDDTPNADMEKGIYNDGESEENQDSDIVDIGSGLDNLVHNIFFQEREQYKNSNLKSVVDVEVTDISDGGSGGNINFWLDKDKTTYGMFTPPSVDIDDGCKAVETEKECSSVVNKEPGLAYSDVVGTSYLLHNNDYAATMTVVPSHLGCTIDCGLFSPDMVVLSKTLIGHKYVSNQMFSVRKQAVDYSFLDDCELSLTEVLADYGDLNFLSMENFLTLRPGEKLDTLLVENWCLNLNALFQAMGDSKTPSRFCVGLHFASALSEICRSEEVSKAPLIDQIFQAFDSFFKANKTKVNLDSDLVLIPMIAFEHFFCVCINFKSKQIEYLDNMSYDNPISEINYGIHAKTIAEVMGCYLCNNGVIKGSHVGSFDVVNIPFKWQLHHSKAGKIDCGVYMMMHMLFYVGDLFDCGLGDEDFRNLYRAEIAAIILLSDLNLVRGTLLDNVNKFEQKKELLFIELGEKRRLEAEKKEKEAAAREVVVADVFSTPEVTNSHGLFQVTPKTVVGSRVRGKEGDKGDGLGCTMYCGPADDKILVVSKMLRVNQALFAKTLCLRKEVIDYCFLDDHDLNMDECLVMFGEDAFLSREEILSVQATLPFSSRVIDCWAVLLNNLEFKDKGSPTAFYFGLRHMDPLLSLYEFDSKSTPNTQTDSTQMDRLVAFWDRFLDNNIDEANLDVDLIFIPLKFDDHYFCVCINFISKAIELLDDRIYKDVEASDAMKLAICVAGRLSDYLDTKGVKTDSNLICFEPVQMKFDWQSTENRDAESGCFLMMNMACYDGDAYESKMRMKTYRRFYGCEMIASLVLADINTYRQQVLERIDKFIMEKPNYWDSLKERRNPTKKAEKKDPNPAKKRKLTGKNIAQEDKAVQRLEPPEQGEEEMETQAVKPIRAIKRFEGTTKSYQRYKIVAGKRKNPPRGKN